MLRFLWRIRGGNLSSSSKRARSESRIGDVYVSASVPMRELVTFKFSRLIRSSNCRSFSKRVRSEPRILDLFAQASFQVTLPKQLRGGCRHVISDLTCDCAAGCRAQPCDRWRAEPSAVVPLAGFQRGRVWPGRRGWGFWWRLVSY
jgi:hypothetical protein